MSKVTLRPIASGRTPHSGAGGVLAAKADGTDRTDELRCEPADDGDVDVAWASPGFWSQGFLPVPKTEYSTMLNHKTWRSTPRSSSACNAASQGHIDARLHRHPHQHARCPIQHPRRQLEPAIQAGLAETATNDDVSRLLDHLMDANHTPKRRCQG
jgi:hypothetical protein